MMVAVDFNPRAGTPLVQARRLATIEGLDCCHATGVFFYFSFRMLKRPATLIGHSVTNSIKSKFTINPLYDHFVRPAGFNHPCNFFLAHPHPFFNWTRELKFGIF
jgi:hypothetical protein